MKRIYVIEGIFIQLGISSKVGSVLMIHVIGIIILVNYFAFNDVSKSGSNGLLITIVASNSTENKSYVDNNTSSQRTHEDLIRNCSTFRDILSAEVAFSCDYSMLYQESL